MFDSKILAPIEVDALVRKDSIVDSLTSEELDKPLSANQGKVIKELIDDITYVVSGKVVKDKLVLTTSDDSIINIDVSALIADTFTMSGSYDVPTQALIIKMNNKSQFSIPVSSLLPVTTDDTLDGNGSGTKLSVALDDDTLMKIMPSGVIGAVIKGTVKPLSGKGTVADPIKIGISKEVDNVLAVKADGLYVPKPPTPITEIISKAPLSGKGTTASPLELKASAGLSVDPVMFNKIEENNNKIRVMYKANRYKSLSYAAKLKLVKDKNLVLLTVPIVVDSRKKLQISYTIPIMSESKVEEGVIVSLEVLHNGKVYWLGHTGEQSTTKAGRSKVLIREILNGVIVVPMSSIPYIVSGDNKVSVRLILRAKGEKSIANGEHTLIEIDRHRDKTLSSAYQLRSTTVTLLEVE